ncbi:MAG: DUF2797 domain-containing protein [Oleiphilaceae bacterium]|nr:DUF2797 domain-containing protein [Oleiphilaceae bacterium]
MSDLLDQGGDTLEPLAEGGLEKMQVDSEGAGGVRYQLRVGDTRVDGNALIGRRLEIEHLGTIYCRHCGRKTSKSFSQGHCYPCFRKLAACDSCIMSPEKCHYHLGTCREPEWGERNCFVPHWVYLANSSGLKVGITRRSQVPVRWMDQGAVAATPVFEVSSRRIAGLIESAMRDHLSDRTNWRTMLKGAAPDLDLCAERERVAALAAPVVAEMRERFGPESVIGLQEPVSTFDYPVHHWPVKIRSHNLDKTPRIQGTLQGIKGQYLMLDTGVINLRKFTAYQVRLSLQNATAHSAPGENPS